MSHVALRRVVVRLLHDPTLAGRLADAPDDALAGVDLTAEERGWLAAVPAAAWRIDPDRPRRVLSALRDEYATTSALAPARAERFFASSHFHGAVQERGSLAIAFGRHMADDADARVVSLATLETAMARVRRAPRRPPASAPGSLRRTPSALVVRVPAGTSDLLAALRSGTTHPTLGTAEEILLVERDPSSDEVTIEALEAGLAAVLEHAARPVDPSELGEVACALGADAAESRALIQRLIADRLLI